MTRKSFIMNRTTLARAQRRRVARSFQSLTVAVGELYSSRTDDESITGNPSIDLRVWWPQSTATETHGRAGDAEELAVLVVALGLLGFYATSDRHGVQHHDIRPGSFDRAGVRQPSQGLILT